MCDTRRYKVVKILYKLLLKIINQIKIKKLWNSDKGLLKIQYKKVRHINNWQKKDKVYKDIFQELLKKIMRITKNIFKNYDSYPFHSFILDHSDLNSLLIK